MKAVDVIAEAVEEQLIEGEDDPRRFAVMILDALGGSDILIHLGELHKVIEFDHQDHNDEWETWAVYTEPE